MKTLWIGTSWKMNKTVSEGITYIQTLMKTMKIPKYIQLFLVLPYTHLTKARELLEGTTILLGAQNMHWENEGAYTGEISPLMLAEIGVRIIELGHSERRINFNEDDFSINRKVIAGLSNGLVPLICVGENETEKDYGVAREIVARQVKIALHGTEEYDFEHLIIAYEPVWSIGEGGTPAEPNYAGNIQSLIREILNNKFGWEKGNKIPIIYGGSVNQDNAVDLIRQPNVNGVFIGRAGLEPDSLLAIVSRIKRTTNRICNQGLQ